MKSEYTLKIVFRNRSEYNEPPFSTIYDPSPYGPETESEAIVWANGMYSNMGRRYDVTLLKNGIPLEY